MPVPWSTHFHWLGVACRYYLRARTRYDVHSPFLANWVAKVLEDRREFYAFDDIAAVRRFWRQSPQRVDYAHDLGAGSRAGQGRQRRVRDLVRWSAIDQFSGQLLFRMVLQAQPKTILELGTNLGFSAMYLRAAARGAQFITIEGNETVARLAAHSLERANLPPVEIRTGAFAAVLPGALRDLQQVDFAWLDGDHRGDATLAYYEQILPALQQDSVLVVGDIHWSADMEQAWNQLKARPEVTLSIDLLHLGVLFFRPQQKAKEDYTLIQARWKPWRLGFW
ncbi:MAG: SAM-dependent methyltransferase [Bacteroidetes bacterium]|nr:MAG: SAM-dependent methyltransferase [Bacteroidota bacterium]PTM13653.1 MAG: SAM-dependent methyltransferase [Bacteroidota bacterium]